jgi:hypothetical protein
MIYMKVKELVQQKKILVGSVFASIVVMLVLAQGLPSLPELANMVLLSTSWGQRLVGQDAAKTVEAVSQLIELPMDEVPTLATVSDSSKLANQPLFAKAQPGDKVLLYPKAKKAYLYRPVTNKLVDVASMQVEQ